MEAIIQRKIEAIQQFMKPNPECDDSAINPVTNKHFELEIDILKNAPRNSDKLEQIINEKEKRRTENNSLDVVDIQTLVREIEMFQFVLYLVNRNNASTFP